MMIILAFHPSISLPSPHLKYLRYTLQLSFVGMALWKSQGQCEGWANLTGDVWWTRVRQIHPWMKFTYLWFLSAMSNHRILPTFRDREADQSSLENDRTPYTNVTTAPTHTLSGRDSVSNETKSLLMDTLGVAETSKVATPNYSKRPFTSGKFKLYHLLIWVNFVSILPNLCWGRRYSVEDTRYFQWSFLRAHQS